MQYKVTNISHEVLLFLLSIAIVMQVIGLFKNKLITDELSQNNEKIAKEIEIQIVLKPAVISALMYFIFTVKDGAFIFLEKRVSYNCNDD